MLCACCCIAAYPQSINQSVEVSNEFESVIGDVNKLGVGMSVPDSLLSFEYDFDYSVFDSPYKGAYEFTPYTIQINPEASRFDGRKLYLKAGAGFLFHPELEAVFAPVADEKSAMSVYADAGGYAQADGHDLWGDAGFENRWVLPNSVAVVGAGYDGVFTQDAHGSINYNSGRFSAGIKSVSEGSYLYYDVRLDGRFGREGFYQMANQNEGALRLSGTAGPVIRDKYRFLLDFVVRQSFSSGIDRSSRTYLSLLPHLSFLLGPADLDAGLKIDYAGDLIFSPVVEASFSVLGKETNLYAGLSGGQKPMTLYDHKMANHRFNTYWMYDRRSDSFSGFGIVEREKMNVYGGIRGHIGPHFQYSLRAGYAVSGNTPLESLNSTGNILYTFNDVKSFYGRASLSWKSEKADFTANGELNKATLDEGAVCFAPALIKGDARFNYNISGRVRAGASLDVSSSRAALGMKGVDSIPSYVDLGINAGYKVNSRWGVWLKGGNLLGQRIQRIPTYVEKGPYFTAGITLSL